MDDKVRPEGIFEMLNQFPALVVTIFNTDHNTLQLLQSF